MYKDKAIDIIKKCKKDKLSQKGKAVSADVCRVLTMFCEQEEEFAQAVVQSDKKVEECIEYTVKDAVNSISDLEVYKRAAEFYFPGAKVQMRLTIDLIGDAAAPPAPKNENDTPPTSKNKLNFSFDDLF